MIDDIPIGKALVAVEVEDRSQCKCRKCVFEFTVCLFSCLATENPYVKNRKDGKNVVYKLVDYQPEGEIKKGEEAHGRKNRKLE